ncbi:flavodoxin family protein [Candidatus Uhrbacteria bacterium]|nr:flavodoxin family protein [Candidatus Uhrbacteria bacterium]
MPKKLTHQGAAITSAKQFHKTVEALEAERKQRMGKPLRILGISCSTTNTDDPKERLPASEKILQDALHRSKTYHGCQTRLIKLRDLNFRHCEANYSIKSEYCTWPCWIQQRYPDDGMGIVYDSLVEWCDAFILATPLRWGSASSLYYQMAQRLNCLENQHALYGRDLVGEKAAGFIITGGQDGIQHVAGEMFSFWSQQGFLFGKRAFVGWTAGGWLNEDMEKTPERLKRDAEEIEHAVAEMVDNLVRTKRALNTLPGAVVQDERPKGTYTAKSKVKSQKPKV